MSDLDRMIESVRHRGSDDRGICVESGVFLGHARLAVLDMTSAGHQPMFSHDERLVVVYNGEIYNFREIRRELESKNYVFMSRSDTEVLIAAWQEWGEACLDKLSGIFAFAMFDRQKRILILARDHLGVKPLFYHVSKDQVVFASELQALFGPLNMCPEVQVEDLDAYFSFNYLPAPRTGLKDVFQLPPGSLLRISMNGCSLRRYWEPEVHHNTGGWHPSMAEEFEHLLMESVSQELVSDVPLGVFLSGGLDSYAVASSAVAAGSHPTAYTLGFIEPGFDESAAARSYSERLRVPWDHCEFEASETSLRMALDSMGELLADASCFPTYQISAFARRTATVILSGDGGDEILAGYDTYFASNITPLVRKMPSWMLGVVRSAASLLPQDGMRYGLSDKISRLLDSAGEGRARDHATFRRIFSPACKRRLYKTEFSESVSGFDPVEEYASLIRKVESGASYLQARQYADVVFHLPSILAKVDRMSMAHNLEVRVPLLNRQLVEFCLNLPDDAKRTWRHGKRLLRTSLAAKIPRNALRRPKAGFLPPVDQWFRSDGPMDRVFEDYLDSTRNDLPILDWQEVTRLWHEHRQNRIDAGFVLLGILQFMNWTRKCRSHARTGA